MILNFSKAISIIVCKRCHGGGVVYDKVSLVDTQCPKCNGSGLTKEADVLKLHTSQLETTTLRCLTDKELRSFARTRYGNIPLIKLLLDII